MLHFFDSNQRRGAKRNKKLNHRSEDRPRQEVGIEAIKSDDAIRLRSSSKGKHCSLCEKLLRTGACPGAAASSFIETVGKRKNSQHSFTFRFRRETEMLSFRCETHSIQVRTFQQYRNNSQIMILFIAETLWWHLTLHAAAHTVRFLLQ